MAEVIHETVLPVAARALREADTPEARDTAVSLPANLWTSWPQTCIFHRFLSEERLTRF